MTAYRQRGQTSTEYLILLAVVIIIALILVGVLANIPGIGGSTRSASTDAFWQTSILGVPSYAFAQVGQDSITIKNNNPSSIVITDLRLHPTLSGVSEANSTIFFENNPNLANQTLAPGQVFQYINGSTHMKPTWNLVNCNSGETYAFYIEIDWTDVQTGSNFLFTGDRNTIEGTCAQ